ncbi:hypothetical protein GIB67_018132 [Kingdonia uniflora]|uniref:Ubiquitin thioesterase OTU n=1 Tax=Kingdonia uniflora TaxID=39325 RepID=A0A7J7NMW4_9MAGN|nr:hypothetical protein GIB67_018132 [Kingdonia uniflora]
MILTFAKHLLLCFPEMFTTFSRLSISSTPLINPRFLSLSSYKFRPKHLTSLHQPCHLGHGLFSTKQKTPLVMKHLLGLQGGVAFGGILFGLLLVCCSNSGKAVAFSDDSTGGSSNGVFGNSDDSGGSHHGKKVLRDYTITGIPGDGRCMFRSVAHGACLRSGKPSPSETLQKKLADDLRARVADEFVKRREETEWFVEGNFDTYISQIRKPHVWGGEPELFMASHVLQVWYSNFVDCLDEGLLQGGFQVVFAGFVIVIVCWVADSNWITFWMPITVYMYDENAGGLISIAEYGQEYGKEDPIRVLYHGFGHYDALDLRNTGHKSRL